MFALNSAIKRAHNLKKIEEDENFKRYENDFVMFSFAVKTCPHLP